MQYIYILLLPLASQPSLRILSFMTPSSAHLQEQTIHLHVAFPLACPVLYLYILLSALAFQPYLRVDYHISPSLDPYPVFSPRYLFSQHLLFDHHNYLA